VSGEVKDRRGEAMKIKTFAISFALAGLSLVDSPAPLARENALQERLDSVIDSAITEKRIVGHLRQHVIRQAWLPHPKN